MSSCTAEVVQKGWVQLIDTINAYDNTLQSFMDIDIGLIYYITIFIKTLQSLIISTV